MPNLRHMLLHMALHILPTRIIDTRVGNSTEWHLLTQLILLIALKVTTTYPILFLYRIGLTIVMVNHMCHQPHVILRVGITHHWKGASFPLIRVGTILLMDTMRQDCSKMDMYINHAVLIMWPKHPRSQPVLNFISRGGTITVEAFNHMVLPTIITRVVVVAGHPRQIQTLAEAMVILNSLGTHSQH